MKILVLSPFGATEPNAENNLKSRAKSGTKVSVDCLRDVFPLPYNTYQYNLTNSQLRDIQPASLEPA